MMLVQFGFVRGLDRHARVLRFGLLLVAVFALVAVPAYAYAQADTSPPSLVDFSFSPVTVDTSGAPATITVTIHLTDDISGVNAGFLNFTSPSAFALCCELGGGDRSRGGWDVIVT